jgi:cobalt-precorrin-5B (C1)-methyltransferase
VGDARAEVIAANAAAAGANAETVRSILQSNTTEEASELLSRANLVRATFDAISQKVAARIAERTKGKVKVSVIIVSMDGKVLGADESARRLEPWLNSA